MIERYHLRYFLAVVDAGNFSRAAAQVNVTQPALSIGIAKLEAAVGAPLFRRNSKRVHLTDEGVELLARARGVEAEFNALTRGLGREPRRVLRLGVLSSIPTRIVQQAVLAHKSAEGAESLEIVEGGERDLLSRLNRRRIDLALSMVRPGEGRFACEPLYVEGYSLIAPRHHLHANEARAGGEAFANDAMIVRRHCEVLPDISRYFTARGVRPRFSFRSTNDDRTLALVKAGLGVTVMPDSWADCEVAAIKLVGFDAERTIGLLFADAATKASASATIATLQAM